jgi:hypothetical protein
LPLSAAILNWELGLGEFFLLNSSFGFMQNVNWEEVNRRFTSAQKAAALLRG